MGARLGLCEGPCPPCPDLPCTHLPLSVCLAMFFVFRTRLLTGRFPLGWLSALHDDRHVFPSAIRRGAWVRHSIGWGASRRAAPSRGQDCRDGVRTAGKGGGAQRGYADGAGQRATTFSVASALIPMFELYQQVQPDFWTPTWVLVTEPSMEAWLEALVQKARDRLDSTATVEPEAWPEAELRTQTDAPESQWATLSRQNSKALRKRPDAPVWTQRLLNALEAELRDLGPEESVPRPA